jgi:hypothetical protein
MNETSSCPKITLHENVEYYSTDMTSVVAILMNMEIPGNHPFYHDDFSPMDSPGK